MLPALQDLQLAVNKLPDNSRGRPPITIRCYGFRHPTDVEASGPGSVPDVMPSLRGRNLGDGLISLGWYTYAPPLQNTQASDSPEAQAYPVREVWGHDKPVIMARPDDAGFATLRAFFDQQFDALWDGCKARDIPPAARLVHAVEGRDQAVHKKMKGFLARVSREAR